MPKFEPIEVQWLVSSLTLKLDSIKRAINSQPVGSAIRDALVKDAQSVSDLILKVQS